MDTESTAWRDSTQGNKRPLGVIAGTGITEHFEVSGDLAVETEYGQVKVYPSADGTCYILPRHGPGHNIPPHMVNYRANIACMRRLGVERVVATSAVGSMDRKFGVGRLGVIGQFLDFTRGRQGTFFDETVRHTDMTNPYSARLNAAIARAGESLGVKVAPGLVYVCVDGPRFETAAEIRMYRKLGGGVVGMTGVPEVVLANEVGIEYSTIVVATNWAAGIQKRISHEEVLEGMKKAAPKVKDLIVTAAELLREE